MSSLNEKELIQWIYERPEEIGRQVGFKDLVKLNGDWIREIVFGTGDYTLLAHRGSYKSSCMAVAIALMLILRPTENVIFVRKADADVSEMMRMVHKILESQLFQDFVQILYGEELTVPEFAQDKLSTSIWTSPMGAPQLLGLGLKSSATGKHAPVLITDDICNLSDRISTAERERTKLQFQEFRNICNRGGRIISLGTRWHKEDVYSLMDNIHIFDCYSTGIMTPEQIREKRRQMVPTLFAANYELKIIADEAALFGAPNMLPDEDTGRIYDGRAHIDAAFDGEDYTAYTILKPEGGRFIGYGKIWRRHVDDCMNEIDALHALYRAGSIAVETNADKGYVAKELRANGYQVQAYSEKQNKFVKIATILRQNWNRIDWISDTDPDYLGQILDYTETAAHDDAPDSAASLLRAMTNSGKIYKSPALKGGL